MFCELYVHFNPIFLVVHNILIKTNKKNTESTKKEEEKMEMGLSGIFINDKMKCLFSSAIFHLPHMTRRWSITFI